MNLLKVSNEKLQDIDAKHLKFNLGQSGFYRTVYNASHLETLGQQIKKGHLSSLDRLGLLADLFEAAKAGYCDTVDALHFMENFQDEDDYAVWDTIASIIGSIRLALADEDIRESMKPFIRKLVAKQLKRLGWERKKSDSHFDQLLRPIILGLAASVDEPAIVKKCTNLFNKITAVDQVAADLMVTPSSSQVKRGADIDPDLRGIVFGTVARHGDKDTFAKLLNLHNNAKLSEERVTLSAALTGFKQSELIDKALATIQTDNVRLQDVVYWIAYSFMNRYSRQQSWQWVQTNWGWLDKNLGKDLSFYRMPIYVARSFSDEAFMKEYKKFFKSVMVPAFDRSFKQGVEMIEWQSTWKAKAQAEVKNFFELQSNSGKNSTIS